LYILSLECVKPSMVLGKDIFHSDGQLLLARGIALTPRITGRLAEMGIRFIYVDDGRYGEVRLDEAVAEETRVEAQTEVRACMNAVAAGSAFDSCRLLRIVHDLIDELLANQGNLISLTDIRAMRDYTFAHCAGVAVLSLCIAYQLGLEGEDLVTLGTGALLHDLGKSLVSPAVLNKPGALLPHEYAEIKRHAESGYYLLSGRSDIHPEAALVAREHHERLNGSGYPQGLRRGAINRFARITAVADVFDAMSTDRVYRRRYLPHETLDTLIGGSGTLFDPEVVGAFCQTVAVYPCGTVVKLHTGQAGVVVRQNRDFPGRPVVRVRVHADGEDRLIDLDLVRELTTFITEVVVTQPL
jgi:HD-GYP domain-containing protein (c-di-GMP phosphodiesterase class II)